MTIIIENCSGKRRFRINPTHDPTRTTQAVMFSWTAQNREQLVRLRAEGDSLTKIASQLGCAISTVSNAINHPPELKTKSNPSPSTPKPLPRSLHSSCPIRKPIDPLLRAAPQPTKEELYQHLALAWRNTAALSERREVNRANI